MENKFNDIMLGDRSIEDWANMYPVGQDASISPEQAVNMGILKPEEQPQQEIKTNEEQPTSDNSQEEQREYKKLSVGGTLADMGKAAGAEALRVFAPKENSLASKALGGWSEEDLPQYQAQTRIGEATKYLYRYGAGTISFIFGGGKVGAGIRVLGAATKSLKTMQLGKGIQKLMGTGNLIKTGANAGKLKKAGAFLGNATLSGSTAGAMADFTLYSKEEGHLADVFGVTDNPLLTYLQTNENDSEATARFKNVVEGFIMGIPFGIGIDGIRLAAGKYFKSTKKVATAQTAEEAAEALPEAVENEQNLMKVLSTAELADTVKKFKEQADTTGGDAEQMILDNLSNQQYAEAKEMLKQYNNGEDIFVHSDGTWDIKVQKWDDARKVTLEEYKKQLKASDELLAENNETGLPIREGDTAINHQDAAVKETWTNRGWIGENETLITQNAKGYNKGNTKAANNIVKNYKDKWKIDNNIKIEFVDGLTINGKAVEGNTQATKYQGKNKKPTKATQTKIDKKKQEIRKLENKIIMFEGTNDPVHEELDLLKEDLRIKLEELKELEKLPQPEKLKDIKIQIDVNAKNPYATLRAELEHARDMAKGTVPNQAEKHFSRYDGMNEAEVASEYVHKKAQGKYDALNANADEQPVIIDNLNIKNKNLDYKFIDNGTSDLGEQWGIVKAYTKTGTEVGTISYVHIPEKNIVNISDQSVIPTKQRQGIATDLIEIIKDKTGTNKINSGVLTEDGENFLNGIADKGVIERYDPQEFKNHYKASQSFMNDGQSLENGEPDVVYIQGAKSKKLKLGEYDVPIDYDIADNIQKINELGYKTGQSHSGKLSDHPYTGVTEDGHGYLSFYKSDLTNEQIANLKLAADKAGVRLVENDKLFFQPAVSIRTARTLDGTFYEDLLQQANKEAGLDKEGWGTAALELREQRLKELVQEHGGLNLDDAAIQKQWDDFTTELEKLTNPQATPQQLKIDFSSAEELPTKLAAGELKEPTLADMDNIITKAAEMDIEVSGTDFKALAKDADNIPQNIKDLLDFEDEATIKAFFSENDETMAVITRKQLFATKVISQLKDKLAELGKNPPREVKKQIIDSINWLVQYKESIGSGLGRGLNEQKFVNQAMATFGSMRFSSLNTQEIYGFVDLLKQITNNLNLNFTRGNIIQNKKEIMRALVEANPYLYNAMLEGGGVLTKQMDSIITELAKNGTKADLDKLSKELVDVFADSEYDAIYEALKLAPDKKGWWNTVKKWTNKQGSLASYYVHNLLSSPSSIFKNVVSGGINTVYFPARKMLVAFDPFTKDKEYKEKMWREGARTYSNLIASWSEAWQLAAQAFLKGEGKFNSFAADTLQMNEEMFKGFHEWGKNDNFGIMIQNIHSVMTRLMGASDEFLSQLNYRAIARAKATEMTDAFCQVNKITNEKDWQDIYKTTFKSFFDEATGKPTDINIFTEAKNMLYQTPLSGKTEDNLGRTLDIRTGMKLEKGEQATQTLVMKLGEKIQNAANKHLFAKFYFPFIKTGVNILQENLDHNIIYNAISPQQRAILTSQTPEGALLRSQCAFGTFSFAFASLIALNGVITGSMPADARERKALLATGWRPYSIKLGNKYISYQGYEPIHTMLGFAADSMNLLMSINNKEDEQKFSKYFLEGSRILVNNFLDKAAFRSGLTSIAALMELTEDNLPNLEKSATQPLQGVLPMSSLIRNTSSLGTRDAKSPQGITERIFNNYFNRGLGEYRRNAFGEKQSITNWIITTSGEQPSDTPEDDELNRLAELGYSPSKINETIAGYNTNYNDFKDKDTGRSAYDIMMDELSQSDIRESIRELVTSDYYQNLPDGVNTPASKKLGMKWSSSDDTKINAINDIFVEYNDRLKEEIVDKYPNLYDSKGVSLQEATEKADLVKEMKSNNNNLQQNADKLFNSLF